MGTSRQPSKTPIIFLIIFTVETSLVAAYFSNNFPIVVVDDGPAHAASHTVTKLIKSLNPVTTRDNANPQYKTQINNPSKLYDNTNNLKYQSLNRASLSQPLPPAKILKQYVNKPDEIITVQSDNVPRPKIKRQNDEADYEHEYYEYSDDDPHYVIDHDGDNQAVAESKKHEEKHEEKHEHGGGGKHYEDSHSSHGEKGDKGYKKWHEHEEGKKGHHDQEDHKKYYEDEGGEKKKKEEDEGYYKEYHHGEKGEKGSKFGEEGEYKKGHSTHGKHVVHKKDEYKKDIDFFDEDHSEEGHEKHGNYHHEYEHSHGGKKKKGHHHAGKHEDKYGEKKEHSKGEHHDDEESYDKSDGEKDHWEHGAKYGKKGGHEEEKKWSHKKSKH